MKDSKNFVFFDLYCEKWANRWGEAVTHEGAPEK